jgi:hypothetical protein
LKRGGIRESGACNEGGSASARRRIGIGVEAWVAGNERLWARSSERGEGERSVARRWRVCRAESVCAASKGRRNEEPGVCALRLLLAYFCWPRRHDPLTPLRVGLTLPYDDNNLLQADASTLDYSSQSSTLLSSK